MTTNNELTEQQRLLLYKLGDAVKTEHIEPTAFGDKATAISSIKWHDWEKKDAKGTVIDSGEKPKIEVQFPSINKVFEYRVPVQTLAAMEKKLGDMLVPGNVIGASLQFVAKKTGSFNWVDAIVTATPEENKAANEIPVEEEQKTGKKE